MGVYCLNESASPQFCSGFQGTGFPIAKFAKKLAVGYTLDEIKK